MTEDKYPTPESVEKASREQLGHWLRFLRPPKTGTPEVDTLLRLSKRFQELGGMTPELSKKIGWGDTREV